MFVVGELSRRGLYARDFFDGTVTYLFGGGPEINGLWTHGVLWDKSDICINISATSVSFGTTLEVGPVFSVPLQTCGPPSSTNPFAIAT